MRGPGLTLGHARARPMRRVPQLLRHVLGNVVGSLLAPARLVSGRKRSRRRRQNVRRSLSFHDTGCAPRPPTCLGKALDWIRLSIYLSVCPSVRLSVCPSV